MGSIAELDSKPWQFAFPFYDSVVIFVCMFFFTLIPYPVELGSKRTRAVLDTVGIFARQLHSQRRWHFS